MAQRKERASPGLLEELREVLKTHRFHTFMREPPKEPRKEYWEFQGERAARMLFGMSTLPIALYRIRDRLLRANVPLLPYFCELIPATVWHVSIGRKVEIGPGVIIPHGYAVIDGPVKIGSDCVINPWVTIGLSGSRRWGFDQRGPIIGDRAIIGTGSKVLGPITIGDDVRIGANAVVIDDIPSGATVVGAPARVVRDKPAEWPW
jgi:serine O-acetyltransferase